MAAWGDDPELLATFLAEVEERLASLQTGLLELESSPSRERVAGLFRDAHTVKGSARMLALTEVLLVAHAMEDVLGAVREGRLEVRAATVDVLLRACDAISRSLPGGPGADIEPVLDELARTMDPRARAAVVPEQSRASTSAMSFSAGAATARAPGAPTAVEPPATPPTAGSLVHSTGPDEQGRLRSDSVRVAAGKVYDLIDVVGEADLGARRIEQTTGSLMALAGEQARRTAGLSRAVAHSVERLPAEVARALDQLIASGDELAGGVRSLRDLVEGHRGGMSHVRDDAMGLAMVPVRRAFAALPRLVREVAQATGTDVRLDTAGEDVEMDKKVLDGIADSLKHLVVNAVDHGRQDPAERLAAGKHPQLVVRVSARSVAGTVVLEVSDDGGGLSELRVRDRAVELGLLPVGSSATGPELTAVLFRPGFSTASRLTEVSGRGVGLDVVRDAVESLGGTIEVTSPPGAGTRFTLVLPVTLGIVRCLIARVGGERYAVPVPGVVESVSLREGQEGASVSSLAGAPVLVRRGVSMPLLDLAEALEASVESSPRTALILRHGGPSVPQIAWAVDRLEGESELVVKDLGPFLGRVPGISGATIDGDGSVVCLLDLRELAERTALPGVRSASIGSRVARPVAQRQAGRPRVLVVEDSIGVRELERVILEGAGYLVETAVDGLDGASRLGPEPADVVVADVEMPGLSGLDLTRRIRRTRGWENVPVIIMTSRDEDASRQAGLEAGCSAYLLKNEFDQDQLVSTVRRLVGR